MDPFDTNEPEEREQWIEEYHNSDCQNCGMDEMDCNCSEDVCCYDPRYTGPEDYCACTEYAKQQELEERTANDSTLCKMCGGPHKLESKDAGNPMEVERKCEECFRKYHQTEERCCDNDLDDLPF